MSSRCPERALAALVLALALCVSDTLAQTRELRVCADPDNLPYSREDGSGFENRIAQLIAHELDARLTYEWYPQRRGFIRRTLEAKRCDVVIGLPRDVDLVRTTAAYYRSSYVFAYRAGGDAAYRGFDDPRLKRARIGVQLIGDDLAATPPGHALALRGLTDNVVGFTIDGRRPQVERMLDALAKGELDVALVWGPQAAHYARLQSVSLALSPAEAPPELASLPFAFDIAMGVRRDDAALQRELDDIIIRRRSDLDAILQEYGVPRVDARARTAGAQP